MDDFLKNMEYLKSLNDLVYKNIQINLKKISDNSDKIGECIINNDMKEANLLLKESQTLLDVNDDYLKQQSSIVKDMTNLKLEIFKKYPDKTLELTIEKIIAFDDNHPFYEDIKFINKLINHYELIEDYEMCEKIKKHLDSI